MNVYVCVPKFRMGRLVATPGALNALTEDELISSLARHLSGDWGDLDEHDREVNESALVEGGRVFSAYSTAAGDRFYIITECDRSATTVLLPNEY